MGINEEDNVQEKMLTLRQHFAAKYILSTSSLHCTTSEHNMVGKK